MIWRLLEAFFRHKLLLLLPPIVIPLVVAPLAYLTAPVYYEAWTSIWVDRPTYLTYNDDWNRYISPAQNQWLRLSEVLRTRTFATDVAQRTQLAPLIGSPTGEAEIQSLLNNGIAAFPNGSHLLALRFRADTADLSLQMINAVVATFRERVAEDRMSQAGLAITFYESRVQAAEQQLNQTTEAVSRYVAANPRLTTIDPDRGLASTAASRLGLPASAVDSQLGELLRQLDLNKADVQRLHNALEQAQFDASASLEGTDLGFQVIDPATLPTTPILERKKLILYPAAGLFIGLTLSSVLLVVLVAADHAARGEADLISIARVIGVVPRLQPRPDVEVIWQQAGRHSIRRAVGYIAGATLPILPPPGRESAAGA